MTAMLRSPHEFQLDGSGPLYKQIRRAIAHPIVTGQCAPGARLPSEQEFTEIFETSRMTVNRALHKLADEGLVVRHRRHGTFVAHRVAEHAVMELRDVVEEIEETGSVYAYELLERRRVKAGKDVAKRFGTRPGSPAMFLKCRHLSDGAPVLIEERYIDIAAVPECVDMPFTETPPGQWLLKNIPWSQAEHTIFAVNADDDMAGLLDVLPGTACLRVERNTWQASQPVTFVVLTYPGNKHRLVGKFAPGE